MMKQIILFLAFLPVFISAQEDNSRYLTGAVPEVNGKVVFQKDISLPGLSQAQIYNAMLAWANENFSSDKRRVVYADEEKGNIAVVGEDYLVFSSSAFSLDRSVMNYRLTIDCENEKCEVILTGIRYEYTVAYQREPEKYTAENWITDKNALTKGKLNRINGKFRKGTIDFADELFKNIDAALGVSTFVATNAPIINHAVKAREEIVPVSPVQTSPANYAPVTNTTTLDGYRQVTPDKIPGNIIKMLSEDWMLITAGNDNEFNMMTASWGGLGTMFGKPVAICYINPTRYTYQLIEKNDTYTFTFYTEAYREVLQYCGTASGRDKDKIKESGLTPLTTPAGSKAFGEAWMIIECKKLLSQPLSTESINDPVVREEWLGKQLHKMYIGEIINVWIK